jgi:hypothetical protein
MTDLRDEEIKLRFKSPESVGLQVLRTELEITENSLTLNAYFVSTPWKTLDEESATRVVSVIEQPLVGYL